MKKPTPSSNGGEGSADVVRSAARAFERDRYLAALLAPASARDDLVALSAFAGDLHRIPSFVSEPMAGEIRLQWWRDTVEAGLSTDVGSSGHPIADAICALARRRAIALPTLHAVIDAISDRLEDTPFETADALAANLRAWDGGLFGLALAVVRNGEASADETRLIADLGVVYGLARTLVEAPAELAQGRIVLPREAQARHGISLESARGPQAMQAWRALSDEVAADIARHLRDTVQRYQEAEWDVRLSTLPIALVRPYLGLTEHVDIAALEARDIGPLSRVWRLWRVKRTGRP